MLYEVTNVYYNSTNKEKTNCIDTSVCGDAGTAQLGNDVYGWPWQLLTKSCQETFKDKNWDTSVWNVNAVPIIYGLTASGASNIILTQGELDPWSGGGYQTNSPGVDEKRGIYVIKIPRAAHHLDLRTPNTCDPNTVSNARYQIVQILKCWLSDCTTQYQLTSLPAVQVPTVKCQDVNFGYPWHQSTSASSILQNTPYLLVLMFYNI
uniref:Lysosomal Pro-X carboxypeptidase n=1 Tax=Heterorhabditis bacteriophora TaxID=37862 RepID=A0A1I7XKA4_HETBA